MHSSEFGMRTSRIEALSDGIYAIAMTLLVLNLALPEAGKGLTDGEFRNLLFGQTGIFVNYALSFILLALFWTTHHRQFHFIKLTNGTLLWINIFTFMFVALVPFSTSLIGDYASEQLAAFFFASNIFILGVLSLSNWVYATKGRLVDRSLTSQRIALMTKRGTVTPLVSAIVMGLSFVDPQVCFYAFLLIPMLLGLLARRYSKISGDNI